jgi:hypothetical protein
VLTVIGDEPLEEKLEIARARYHVVVQPAENVLRRLVLASQTDDEAAHWLGSAAIHAIVVLELEELYPQLVEAAERSDETLVRETAMWAGEQLGLAPA